MRTVRTVVREHRGIHLDLKGLPPTPARLREWPGLLAAVGVNTVLVEWEDMFPWQRQPETRHAKAYAMLDVRDFLRKTDALSIEAIPLVQCFGHLETVLGAERFKPLREVPDNPAELCPLAPGAREMILTRVDELIEAHGPRLRHLHLGGDEAWTLGSCARCRQFVRRHGRAALYRHHVLPLVEHVNARGVRPILWDDMMRGWTSGELMTLAGRVDLMVWSYGARIPEAVVRSAKAYAAAGINIWGAPAFKGANGHMADVPDLDRRRQNVMAMLALGAKVGFRGVVATGWSRHNAYLAPCESLEASLDALLMAAWAMRDGALAPTWRDDARTFLENLPGGTRFAACRAAAERVAEWREHAACALLGHGRWPPYQNWVSQAFFHGETGRRNPRVTHLWVTQAMRRFERDGRERLRAWRRAHQGLVRPAWLKAYADSRLAPLVWFRKAIQEQLAEE